MRYLFSLLSVLFCMMPFAGSIAQTGHFEDSFDTDKGWKIITPEATDSALVKLAGGSLQMTSTYSTRMVAFSLPDTYSNIDWSKHDEWEIRIRFRHISGVEDRAYGICIGATEGKTLNGGMRFSLSGNGYYVISKYDNRKLNSIKPWTYYSKINKQNGEVNEIRIIKRPFDKIYLLINGAWAFMNKGFYVSGSNTISFYVEGSQEIAVDEISAKSFKGTFNKVAKHNEEDFMEVCRASVNGFEYAKGFELNGQYKSWLPTVFISNAEYLIKADSLTVFPPAVEKNKLHYIYSISSYFRDTAMLSREKTKLTGMIEKCLKDFDRSEAVVDSRNSIYYFSKNTDLPEGVIACIQEYEVAENKYIVLNIFCAPGIKPF